MALDKYDDEMDAIPPGGRAGAASLKDGEYDLEIESAELKETQTGAVIFTTKMVIIGGPSRVGKDFEHAYWLTGKPDDHGRIGISDVKVGILKKELTLLGFDAENWTKANGRPFLGMELPRAALLLPGLRVVAKKTTNGEYANLSITARNVVADQRPEKFGPGELAAAATAEAEPFKVD